MGLRCIVLAQAVVGSVLPCVLQTTALFTPAWLVQDGVYKGLFYSRQRDGHNVYEVLDQATLGLEATSAILLLLCSISCCVTALVYGPDEYDDIDNDDNTCFGCNCVWFYCNLFAYVVADILILSGCCKFGANHPMEQLGASFYLCIVSFLLILLMVIVGSIIPCCLQMVGLFTLALLVHDGVYKGLFYSLQTDGNRVYEVLDEPTLGTEATAAVLLLLCSVSCCISALVYGPDEDDLIYNNSWSKCYTCNCVWFYLNLWNYIVADILILSGCCKFGATHPMENVGVSFYLCLVSFLLILLMICIFLCDYRCKSKRDEGVFHTLLEKVYEDAL